MAMLRRQKDTDAAQRKNRAETERILQHSRYRKTTV